MLVQSSLPPSIEATLLFASNPGKHDKLCNSIPHPENRQMCAGCDEGFYGGCGKPKSSLEETKDGDDPCSLNLSISQLPSVRTMSGSAPNFVYTRKKLRQNTLPNCLAQGVQNTGRLGECFSVASSDSVLATTRDQLANSQLDHKKENLANSVFPRLKENGQPHILQSVNINRCSTANGNDSEAPKNSVRKKLQVDSVNDSCSSSKSNVELLSASMRAEVDETAECSSSSVRVREDASEYLSGRDLCISILRSQGLLGGVLPNNSHSISDDSGSGGYSRCLRSCKTCGRSALALKMLICDLCEEAFHVSCCNHRSKNLPIDEWFCHSCLKKMDKALKETNKLTDIMIDMGRFRNVSKSESSPIALMLKDPNPCTNNVRIGKGFQANVPEWAGPVNDDVGTTGEPVEMDTSEYLSVHEGRSNKPSRLGSIGNWLQCREAVDGIGGIHGTICGKWRRAPLFEVQTDDWECFRSVRWDPSHADCTVPQELETDQVLKQLKYIEMLRPRLAAKKRRLDQNKDNDDMQPPSVDTGK